MIKETKSTKSEYDIEHLFGRPSFNTSFDTFLVVSISFAFQSIIRFRKTIIVSSTTVEITKKSATKR